MKRMIGVCGLDCGPCEARIATQADDPVAKQQVAAKWREQFQNPAIDEFYVSCDGCRSGSASLCGWARVCPLRLCAIGRNVASCARCGEYDVCEKLAEFEKEIPGTKDRLAKIKAELKPATAKRARRRTKPAA